MQRKWSRKNYLFENAMRPAEAIGRNAVKFASKMEIISFFRDQKQAHIHQPHIERPHKTATCLKR